MSGFDRWGYILPGGFHLKSKPKKKKSAYVPSERHLEKKRLGVPRWSDIPKRKGPGLPKGEAHPSAKLTEEQVIEIRRAWDYIEKTQTQLAQEYGVSIGNINSIVRRKIWRHVK